MALGAGLLGMLGFKSSTSREPSTISSPAVERVASQRAEAVPSFFLCPITYEIMADPVTLDTGMTYDRAAIEEWLDNGHNTCPSTNRTLLSHNVIPNVTLQRAIRDWCNQNRSSGNVDTVSRLLEALATCGDAAAFHGSVKELYAAAEESGRTRRTLRELGAIAVLTRAIVDLDARITVPADRNWTKGLQYAIATIAMLHPSDDDEKCCLSVPGMVTVLASVVAKGNTTAKINAVKVMQSVVWDDRLKVLAGNHWGAMKGVLMLVRDDGLSAAETRLGLRCLLSLVGPVWNRVAAINDRAVHALVEIIRRPRVEKRSVEYAFAILEVLANCAEGREAITNHPAAIPRIVEYLHGVSGAATEYAVGTLHCVISLASNRSVISTALQAGAFTTLLMLLPSECSPRTKTKARDILKLLNDKYASRPGDDDFSVFIERGSNRHQQQQPD